MAYKFIERELLFSNATEPENTRINSVFEKDDQKEKFELRAKEPEAGF
jgi:hypothetical protein